MYVRSSIGSLVIIKKKKIVYGLLEIKMEFHPFVTAPYEIGGRPISMSIRVRQPDADEPPINLGPDPFQSIADEFVLRTREFLTQRLPIVPRDIRGGFGCHTLDFLHNYTWPNHISLREMNGEHFAAILEDLIESGEEFDITEVIYTFHFFLDGRRGGGGGKIPAWVKVRVDLIKRRVQLIERAQRRLIAPHGSYVIKCIM